MFQQFMTDLIHKDSFKRILSEDAMNNFAKEEGVLFVHSPILYRLYTLFAGDVPHVEDRPMFYRKAGMYLYYERFTCNHGEEFYYYIKFNKDSKFYQEHKFLIETLIVANDPSTLTDYIGTKDLHGFNKALKENKL